MAEVAGKNDVDGLMAAVQKDYGKSAAGFGKRSGSGERIPTGFFAFDIASNGGFPRGQCSIVYGAESSGKTTLALAAIAQHQRLWPKQKNVYVDVEHTLDIDWAKVQGVDTDRLLVVHPHYGEQVVDVVEGFLGTSDCGLVVLDSIAAMIPALEADNTAERVQMGGNSLLVGKLYRKTVLQLAKADLEGRRPTLLYINQNRTQIGSYGSPQGMPGGQSIRFQSAMTVQCYAKPVIDAKISATLPYAKHMTLTIKKWKVPIIGNQCEFDFTLVPHGSLLLGQADDWSIVRKYLFDCGKFVKNEAPAKGYQFLGLHVLTQDAAREMYRSDPQLQEAARNAVRNHLLSSGVGSMSGEMT